MVSESVLRNHSNGVAKINDHHMMVLSLGQREKCFGEP
jgi:hypothetical protein